MNGGTALRQPLLADEAAADIEDPLPGDGGKPDGDAVPPLILAASGLDAAGDAPERHLALEVTG